MRASRLRIASLVIAASVAAGAGACAGPTTPAEAAGTRGDTAARHEPPPKAADPDVTPVLTMRNVQFRFTKDLSVDIERIRAQMRPVPPATVVTFDDPSTFDLDVSGASVRLSLQQAEVLMN